MAKLQEKLKPGIHGKKAVWPISARVIAGVSKIRFGRGTKQPVHSAVVLAPIVLERDAAPGHYVEQSNLEENQGKGREL